MKGMMTEGRLIWLMFVLCLIGEQTSKEGEAMKTGRDISNSLKGRTTMKATTLFAMLTAVAAIAVGTANATEISVPDFSFTPDGTTSNAIEITDIKTLNGGTAVLATAPTVAYFVTRFNFGANSDAHFQAQFLASAKQNRIGVDVNDDGLVQSFGTGDGALTGGINKRSTYNLAQNMAGKTVVLLAKLHFDANNNVTYGSSNASDDTLMNVWVNPTSASVEGSGLSAGNLYALWNSSVFWWWKNTVQNQSTPGTAGASSITGTVILTGANATFENALAIALGTDPTTLIVIK